MAEAETCFCLLCGLEDIMCHNEKGKTMKKRLVAGLLAVLMVFSLSACGASEAAPEVESTTHTITDLLGREVTIPNDIQRIAAIAGHTYEMVFMLGSADQITMVKSGHTDSYPHKNADTPDINTSFLHSTAPMTASRITKLPAASRL